MPRTRIHNVSAAQWSSNGESLGALDLTQVANQVFGANVFSLAEQRKRLPKHVYSQLRATVARGAELDTSLADAVAQAMKEWALERLGDRRFLGQGADPGRAGRLELPDRRHPRHL
jgi:glutamine synthetase